MKFMILELVLGGSIRANPWRATLRGIIVLMLAGFASITQGGIITSGSFSLSGFTASATVSGDNFAATVVSTEGGFNFSGFPPFQPHPGVSWIGEFGSSGVLYNGVFYPVPPSVPPSPGVPFALASFSEKTISTPPIVAGPGTYNLLFSVELNFQLFDASHAMFHTETDTGFAAGSITYTACCTDNTFLVWHGLEATIIPEPSTWSCIAFAACCLGAFAGIRLRHQLPGHGF